ncbi:hypothetical protein BU25DRAFT_420306 [Macroventuria anomochaeta]|uniref:Uncharacterized protein n=1 Tax=Macroventuria anomochaeta TaxID=301207 RepID=A0ACB6S8C6_9PLEO|nr:uncharacterized protein BU25DRAFT_420306 [Macroventuria anomochaeta]KAF2629469.1 hypothetical protein BU25DRAFT_420306 [Macroventuria anomochaeta]
MRSDMRMEEVIGTLYKYSFLAKQNNVRQHPRQEWYAMHRPVHLATWVWVKKYSNLSDVMEKAVRHVAGVFLSDDYVKEPVWRAYLPHALQLLERERGSDAQEVAKLCLLVQDAVELLEIVVKAKEALQPDHPSRLASQQALAMTYEASKQVQEAADLPENVVKIRTRILRADHPSLLISVEALADMCAELAVDSAETSLSSSPESPSMAGSGDFVVQQYHEKRHTLLSSTHIH